MKLLRFIKPRWAQPRPKIENTRQLFFVIFTLFSNTLLVPGLGLFYFTVTGAVSTWDWQEASCFIEESKLTPSQNRSDLYELFARVRYQHKGTTIRAESNRAASSSFSTDEIPLVKAKFKSGSNTRCFVELAEKSFILGRNIAVELKVLFLSILLTPIMLQFSGSLIAEIRGYLFGKSTLQPTVEIKQSSIHSKWIRNTLVRSILSTSIAIVIVAGTSAGGNYFAESNSKGWRPTSCTVLIKERKSPDSELKDLLVYEYRYKGRNYRNSHVKPFGVGLLSEMEKQTIEQLDPGDAVECWVNDSRPFLAKLTPDTPTSFYNRF